MRTLLYFERLICWAQRISCVESWTPKATGCSLIFWEATIPPITIMGAKHRSNSDDNDCNRDSNGNHN